MAQYIGYVGLSDWMGLSLDTGTTRTLTNGLYDWMGLSLDTGTTRTLTNGLYDWNTLAFMSSSILTRSNKSSAAVFVYDNLDTICSVYPVLPTTRPIIGQLYPRPYNLALSS